MKKSLLTIGAGSLLAAISASANIFITEWIYSAADGEFIELTNTGPIAIDMNAWSYDDNSRTPDVFDLSAFGLVNPGESVILTEAVEADFRDAWALAASVKVIGGVTNNLGRNDEINIYDLDDNLVDQLTYGDGDFPGTIRTQGVSGTTTPNNYGANDVSEWVFSVAGVNGAYTSTGGDVGSPGVIPEPESFGALTGLVIIGLGLLRRRKRA